MYSVLLMAALSTGASTPATFFHHGWHGGYGGCGGWGCWGCTGCWGGHRGWGCNGGYGGAGHGSGWGCNGCYGSWGHWGTCYGCHGCYGCYGCYGCGGGTAVVPSQPMGIPPAEEIVPPKPKEDGKPAAMNPRARLIVELPADAKLYVDDYASTATGKRTRTFNTPALESGQTYYYILRAEMVLNGEQVTETKRVLLRPGSVVRTSFEELLAKEKGQPATTVTSSR